jgi:hypothetical protein
VDSTSEKRYCIHPRAMKSGHRDEAERAICEKTVIDKNIMDYASILIYTTIKFQEIYFQVNVSCFVF